jgi:oligo-1,6-glucosidase
MRVVLLNLIGLLLLAGCQTKQAVVPESQQQAWWKEAIVYQIYPRSFQDSNGDGVGDLQGIIDRLDYIESLGINTIWLNPIYPSPNADNGYDVSDYRGIAPEFGDMETFDRLLGELHQRGIKLIMDVVVNHSSDEHPWFIASRSDVNSPYRDYYHWWPASKGTPHYRYSLFDAQGDAWKYDSITDAYYLHYFADKQPDLNWENPALRQEVYDLMKFWAQKGVDGFRLDAFQFAAKDTAFPELPQGYEKNFIQYYAMQPGLHDYLKEMNQQVFAPYGVVSVAEGAGRSFEEAHELVDADRQELQMAYAFDGVDVAKYDGYSLATLKQVFTDWDRSFAEKGWLSIFLSNHDQARLVSRYGNDSPEFRVASIKLLNTFLLTMRGTPYVYYGDELGMTNLGMDRIEEYQDVAAVNGYAKATYNGEDLDQYMKVLAKTSRENGRTPMQWTADTLAGFTTGIPWMKINPNTAFINVQDQVADPSSPLNHFKSLTQLRKKNPVLVYGAYELLAEDHPQVYAYTRTLGEVSCLVVLNFSDKTARWAPIGLSLGEQPWINSADQLIQEGKELILAPFQSIVIPLN